MSNFTMEKADLLIHASWIVPGSAEELIHENSCLVVSEGKIREILESRVVPSRYQAEKEMHLTGFMRMPLVHSNQDSHSVRSS
jgi:cytosine/adenosine deaminase-related metal-dependent hydrolase